MWGNFIVSTISHLFVTFSHLFPHLLISNQDNIKRQMKCHKHKFCMHFPMKIPWKWQFSKFLLYFHTYFHILQDHVNYLRIFPSLHKCSRSGAKKKKVFEISENIIFVCVNISYLREKQSRMLYKCFVMSKNVQKMIY